jgi:hypothetical protein
VIKNPKIHFNFSFSHFGKISWAKKQKGFLEKRFTNFSISQNWKKKKKKPPNPWMILVARWA